MSHSNVKIHAGRNGDGQTRLQPSFLDWDSLPLHKKLLTSVDVQKYQTSLHSVKFKGMEDMTIADVAGHKEWWVEDVYEAFRNLTSWPHRKYTAQHIVAVSRLIVAKIIEGSKSGSRSPLSPEVRRMMGDSPPVEGLTCIKRLKDLIEVLERKKIVAMDLLEWCYSENVLNDILIHPQAYGKVKDDLREPKKSLANVISSIYLDFYFLTPSEKFHTDEELVRYFSHGQQREDIHRGDKSISLIKNWRMRWIEDIYDSIVDVGHLEDSSRSNHSCRFIKQPGVNPTLHYDKKYIQAAVHLIFDTSLEGAVNGYVKPTTRGSEDRHRNMMTFAERLSCICYVLRCSKKVFDNVHLRGRPKTIELVYNPQAYMPQGSSKVVTTTGNAIREHAEEGTERSGSPALATQPPSKANSRVRPLATTVHRLSTASEDEGLIPGQDIGRPADHLAENGKKRKRAEPRATQVSSPDARGRRFTSYSEALQYMKDHYKQFTGPPSEKYIKGTYILRHPPYDESNPIVAAGYHNAADYVREYETRNFR